MASLHKHVNTGNDDDALDKSKLSPIDNLFASKERSQPTTSTERRLLPLLPKPSVKPDITSKPQSLKRKPPPIPGRCGIPQCEQTSCRITSHRKYMQVQRHIESKKEISSSVNTSQLPSRQGSLVDSNSELASPIIIDTGFPELPLPEAEKRNPILRQMFHDFFDLLKKIQSLLVTPFPGHSTSFEQKRQTLFQYGTRNPLDCLNFMGASYVYHSARASAASQDKEATALLLQNMLVKTFREALETLELQKDVNRILNVIFTLVVLDMNASQGEQVTTLIGHRMAMSRLVASAGGIHNLGRSVPVTLSLDRVLSIQTGLPPLYTSWESVTLPISRAEFYPRKYGSFFSSDLRRCEVDPDIVDYCDEACRATEILEGERWEFDGEPRESTPEIYYLYYLRDRIAAKWSQLHARTNHDRTRDRCILLAAKMVEYRVLSDNYIASLTMSIAHRLRELLQIPMEIDMWAGWDDVYLWIVFVLACMPKYWKGHEWSIAFCYESLQRRYGKIWPPGWRKRELENVRRFIWSSSRLDTIFEDLCDEIAGSGVTIVKRGTTKTEPIAQRPHKDGG